MTTDQRPARAPDRGFAIHKVVMLGEGGVGKSALVMQFVSHVFLDFHDPTIEDAYQSQIVVDSQACHLDILDTAGQEEFTAMREQYMRHGEGFILVYSITDQHSFERLRNHIQLMRRVRNFEKVPMILIGNKLDMEERRQVSRSDALALSRELECPFFETSAPYRQNVEEMFIGLVREIRKKEKASENDVDARKRGTLKRIRKILGGMFRS